MAREAPPGGRQVRRRSGRRKARRQTPTSFFAKRTAEAWLRAVLEQVRAGKLPAPGEERSVTFAVAAPEWLRFVEEEPPCKPSTLRACGSSVQRRLIPSFGARRIDGITPQDVERWRAQLAGSSRTKNKLLTELHGILGSVQRAFGLRTSRRRESRSCASGASSSSSSKC